MRAHAEGLTFSRPGCRVVRRLEYMRDAPGREYVVLLVASRLFAHPGTVAVRLHERGGGSFDVEWKEPAAQVPGGAATPLLPARCRDASARTRTGDAVGVVTRWTVECGSETLAGGGRHHGAGRRARSSASSSPTGRCAAAGSAGHAAVPIPAAARLDAPVPTSGSASSILAAPIICSSSSASSCSRERSGASPRP